VCGQFQRPTPRLRGADSVVVPTEHLKTQWALAAARVGIALDPKFSNSSVHTSSAKTGLTGFVRGAAVGSQLPCHRAVLTCGHAGVSRRVICLLVSYS